MDLANGENGAEENVSMNEFEIYVMDPNVHLELEQEQIKLQQLELQEQQVLCKQRMLMLKQTSERASNLSASSNQHILPGGRIEVRNVNDKKEMDLANGENGAEENVSMNEFEIYVMDPNVHLELEQEQIKLQQLELQEQQVRCKQRMLLLKQTSERASNLSAPSNWHILPDGRIEVRNVNDMNLEPRDTDSSYGAGAGDSVENIFFDAPLAESLAVDSGSEVDEEENLTADQVYEILEEEDGQNGEDEVEGGCLPYEWSADYSAFSGRREAFQVEVGPQIAGTTPLDIFCQFWDQPLLEMIVEETNKYAWQTIVQASESATGILPHSRLNDWVETSVAEIYRLLGVIILMGMTVMGRIDEYWSKGYLGMPGFRAIMSKGRYIMLIKFLHFADNYCIPEHGDYRKIAKIQPLIEYLIRKFQTAYSPRRELSIDESLLLWKGRLSWVQSIRTKASRFGIKSYELCEGASGYVLNLFIYCGKGSTSSETLHGFQSSTAKTVLQLFSNYFDKGYTLYMDNFYNSVELCRYLKSRRTDVVGTLNPRRLNTPGEVKGLDERRLARGHVVSRHCGDISVTAWKDVKLVTTVSTYHDDELVASHRAGRPFLKPKVVEEYNKFMGGVDLKDQKLSMYLLERKRGIKWYLKVFRRLLNISILNSYIIYSNIEQNKKMTHRQFRYALAAEICERYDALTRQRVHNDIVPKLYLRLDRSRDHFPEQMAAEGERANNKQNKYKRARCVRCLKTAPGKRTMTSIFCSQCHVFLCVGQCWREYHTLEII